MKRKIGILLLTVTAAAAMAAGLAACSSSDGASAYDLAVENGYTGTVTEWLESLKGADGTNGTNGTNGTDGVDGADGADGATGTAGTAGTNGTNGVGIQSIELNQYNDMVVTYTDASTTTLKYHGTESNPYVINEDMYSVASTEAFGNLEYLTFLDDSYFSIAAGETIYFTVDVDSLTYVLLGGAAAETDLTISFSGSDAEWDSTDDYYYMGVNTAGEYSLAITNVTASDIDLTVGLLGALTDVSNYYNSYYNVSEYTSMLSASLSVGDNYILLPYAYNSYLSETDSPVYGIADVTNMPFAGGVDGTYTFSIEEGSEAVIRLTDANGDTYDIDADNTSVSIDADSLQNITISYIGATSDTQNYYLFNLKISYVYKEINEGAAAMPKEVTDITDGDFTAYIAAGSSYYFTVATTDETIVSMRYSTESTDISLSSGGNALTFSEGYTVSGTNAVKISEYVFKSTSTAVTYVITNSGSETASVTMSFATWDPCLSTAGTATYVVDTSWLTESYLELDFVAVGSQSYIITLEDGTSDNLAITAYYVRNDTTYDVTVTYENGGYVFTNPRSYTQSIVIKFTYSGSDETVTIKAATAIYDADDYADYSTTLGSSVTMDGENKAYVTYTVETAGYYNFVFGSTDDSITVKTISSDGNIEYDGTLAGVVVLLAAGENKIAIDYTTAGDLTVNVMLLFEESAVLATGSALSTGTNYIVGGGGMYYANSYTFTAGAAGTYTFTVKAYYGDEADVEANSNDSVCESADVDDMDYLTYVDATTSITLAAGDIVALDCYYSAIVVLEITYTEAE